MSLCQGAIPCAGVTACLLGILVALLAGLDLLLMAATAGTSRLLWSGRGTGACVLVTLLTGFDLLIVIATAGIFTRHEFLLALMRT